MIFKQVLVGSFQNFSYIIGDDSTRTAALVDPAWEVDKLLRLCSDMGLTVSFIINTHSHSDHVGGNEEVSQRTKAKIVAHVSSPVDKDLPVRDGDTINVGNVTVRVIHTPGHCPDHICLLIDGKLLTGDTLFVGECGRTDLLGGNSSEMYDSLNKLLKLDDSIEVHPGHDYGPKQSSTIGYERQNNYTLEKRTREQFIQFMQEP